MTIEGVKLVQNVVERIDSDRHSPKGDDVNQDQWDWLAMDPFQVGIYIYIASFVGWGG